MISISNYGNIFIGTKKNNKKSQREIDIEIIDDLRNGRGFEHYKARFLKADTSTVSDDDLRKIYHSRNEVDTVIRKLVSYCPSLEFIPNLPLSNEERAKEQKKCIDRWLNFIKWNSKLNNIYDDQESKGDVFFYMYFDSPESKQLRLKPLNAKNMKNRILDENGEAQAYVYEEYYTKTVIDNGGNVNEAYTGKIIYVFEKGKTRIYSEMFGLDETTQKYLPVLDDNKKPKYSEKIILNRKSYIDDIAIVHIPSYLRDGDEFSSIPASNYIEHGLTLDDLNSNIRMINMLLGFPIVYIINGKVTKGERKPGGFIYVDNKMDESGSMAVNNAEAKVQDLQITNKLESLFTYYKDEDDALRESAGLVSKTLQLKLGSSDSSRVIKQLIAPMENKIELYVDNILEAMRLPIKVQLKENGLYDDELDYGITLHKPEFIVKVSPFDEQIWESNELTKGTKNKKEIGLRNGESFEEIEARENNLENNVNVSNESTDIVRSANNI